MLGISPLRGDLYPPHAIGNSTAIEGNGRSAAYEECTPEALAIRLIRQPPRNVDIPERRLAGLAMAASKEAFERA